MSPNTVNNGTGLMWDVMMLPAAGGGGVWAGAIGSGSCTRTSVPWAAGTQAKASPWTAWDSCMLASAGSGAAGSAILTLPGESCALPDIQGGEGRGIQPSLDMNALVDLQVDVGERVGSGRSNVARSFQLGGSGACGDWHRVEAGSGGCSNNDGSFVAAGGGCGGDDRDHGRQAWGDCGAAMDRPVAECMDLLELPPNQWHASVAINDDFESQHAL